MQLGDLAHDADGAEASLLADVRALATNELLNLAGEVACHLGRGDVAQGAAGKAVDKHVGVVHVAVDNPTPDCLAHSRQEGLTFSASWSPASAPPGSRPAGA